ncbi:hypothetical protein L1987_74618 [Smallanthus sonchifolius]|uniref:Uncharacterized protein n=1 Tax=Smallanthus sonchifolius TaxID=185202 RepID=A0ACB9A2G7_9ASTR|nr:hypothetical protein L1987_74618 [Smallanthus sonchifolius]
MCVREAVNNWRFGYSGRYCITTNITDETATASATFFNQVVLSLLGYKCKEVVKQGYGNQHEIPRPFLEAIW